MRLLLVVLGIILVLLAILVMSGRLDHDRVLRDPGGKVGAPVSNDDDGARFEVDTGGYPADSPQAAAPLSNETPGAP